MNSFKLLLYFILATLPTVSLTADRQCNYNISTLLEHDLTRLKSPDYIEIRKNNLNDDYELIKITSDSSLLYSNKATVFSKLMSNTVNQKVLSRELVTLHTVIQNNKMFIIYPVSDLTNRYIAGLLILGYEKEVILDEKLNLGLRLFSAYLSQFITECKTNEF